VPHSEYAISLRNARYVGAIESANPPEGYLDRITARKKEAAKKDRKKIVVRAEKISKREVALHKSAESCWIILDKKVYDVTDYLDEHPGGIGKVMEFAGIDGTLAFLRQGHSKEAETIRDKYYIGDLEAGSNVLLLLLGLVILAGAAYCMLLR
jgi:cytochrome b involved in lipid metabolism